jgi:DNA uptake protein ComE-like DNA-binding protein
MKAFLAGLGLGAAVGVLLAPQDGRKTRTMLSERAVDWFERLQNGNQDRSEPAENDLQSEAVADILNTANRSELMSVNGIGKGTATRIMKHRPYESAEQVLQEGVLPEETLERVKEQLVDTSRNDKSSNVA